MRGFINSGAVLIFVFSLIVFAFSFLITQNELSNSVSPSYIVETARWYADASNYSCRKNFVPSVKDFSPSLQLPALYTQKQRNRTVNFNNDLVRITELYNKNYPPLLKFEEPKGDNLQGRVTFKWSSCDGDAEKVYHSLAYADATDPKTWTTVFDEKPFGLGWGIRTCIGLCIPRTTGQYDCSCTFTDISSALGVTTPKLFTFRITANDTTNKTEFYVTKTVLPSIVIKPPIKGGS